MTPSEPGSTGSGRRRSQSKPEPQSRIGTEPELPTGQVSAVTLTCPAGTAQARFGRYRLQLGSPTRSQRNQRRAAASSCGSPVLFGSSASQSSRFPPSSMLTERSGACARGVRQRLPAAFSPPTFLTQRNRLGEQQRGVTEPERDRPPPNSSAGAREVSVRPTLPVPRLWKNRVHTEPDLYRKPGLRLLSSTEHRSSPTFNEVL